MNHRFWPKGATLLSILLLGGCGAPSFEVRWYDTGTPDEAVEEAQPEARPESGDATLASASIDTPTADELWQSALDSGMSAARLAQNAISPQDWELVAARWGRAIEVLKTIPEAAPNYAEVQAKIEQYSQNQAIAQQRYQRMTAGVPTTADTTSNPESTLAAQTPQPQGQAARPVANPAAQTSAVAIALCQGVRPNTAGQPITISNLRFYRPPATPYDFGNSGFDASPEEDYLIGCLTNNSNQAFSTVSIEFTSKIGNGGGFSAGGLELPVQVIQPGTSVPFRGPFGIDPEATEIVVTKLIGLDSSYQPIRVSARKTSINCARLRALRQGQ